MRRGGAPARLISLLSAILPIHRLSACLCTGTTQHCFQQLSFSPASLWAHPNLDLPRRSTFLCAMHQATSLRRLGKEDVAGVQAFARGFGVQCGTALAWNYALGEQAESILLGSTWFADAEIWEDVCAVVQVKEEPNRERVALLAKTEDAAAALLTAITEENVFSWGPKGKTTAGRAVFFASVSDNNNLWKAVQRVAQHYGAICSYEEPCFLLAQESPTSSARSTQPQESPAEPNTWLSPLGAGLRPLRQEDAEQVDSMWTYKSETSLAKIKKIIAERKTVGMEQDGQLVSWVLGDADGGFGMLHTLAAHRKRGHGEQVVKALAAEFRAECEQGRRDATYCWVVRENAASLRLMAKQGFRNVERNWWAVFYPGPT